MFMRQIHLFGVLAITVSLVAPVALAGPAPTKAKSGKPATAVASAVPAVVEIPVSTFEVPSNPRDGRNPFFPMSTAGVEVKPVKPGPRTDFSAFVLNGITSPPRQTAMINGRTFEPGEEGEVKVSNGKKVLIKCTEIRQTSAIILVAGQIHEVRFRSGF